jgi:hypothetical protein
MITLLDRSMIEARDLRLPAWIPWIGSCAMRNTGSQSIADPIDVAAVHSADSNDAGFAMSAGFVAAMPVCAQPVV